VALLAAILIALVIGLWVAAGKEISAREWLLTGLPAWLQGVGTVAAAYLAWYAFGTWQRQEVARRRAEWAEKMLHLASEIAFTLEHARTRRRIPVDVSITSFAESLLTERALVRLQDLKALTDKLQTLGLSAGHILGPDVTERVQGILELEKTLSRAYRGAVPIVVGFGEVAPRRRRA
jgi:hypothetical protein